VLGLPASGTSLQRTPSKKRAKGLEAESNTNDAPPDDPELLQYQHRAMVKRLQEKNQELAESRAQIASLGARQGVFEQAISTVNAAWSQLNQDLQLILSRFRPQDPLARLPPVSAGDSSSLPADLQPVPLQRQSSLLAMLIRDAGAHNQNGVEPSAAGDNDAVTALAKSLQSRSTSTLNVLQTVLSVVDSVRSGTATTADTDLQQVNAELHKRHRELVEELELKRASEATLSDKVHHLNEELMAAKMDVLMAQRKALRLEEQVQHLQINGVSAAAASVNKGPDAMDTSAAAAATASVAAGAAGAAGDGANITASVKMGLEKELQDCQLLAEQRLNECNELRNEKIALESMLYRLRTDVSFDALYRITSWCHVSDPCARSHLTCLSDMPV